ncbi:DUF1737 domain-containing protein [Fodinicola acaciae]|uniref:DUF1737 domain-containing protein n=1 Tax=Fodinicola acaciae TaxID=2681555 RepID=UPI001FE49BAA|nr:DUF1737 domain-containing protein [Fodinicola acaciae]
MSERLRYRVLTGPDDAEFCRRVSMALDEGYELHGSPSITHDGTRTIVAQAVVLPPYAAASFRPSASSAAPIADPSDPPSFDKAPPAAPEPQVKDDTYPTAELPVIDDSTEPAGTRRRPQPRRPPLPPIDQPDDEPEPMAPPRHAAES